MAAGFLPVVGGGQHNRAEARCHCAASQVTQARGLCWRCYADKAIRARYPLIGRVKQYRGNGSAAEVVRSKSRRPAANPVKALPGSEERIAAMRQRLERGEELYHKGDEVDKGD